MVVRPASPRLAASPARAPARVKRDVGGRQVGFALETTAAAPATLAARGRGGGGHKRARAGAAPVHSHAVRRHGRARRASNDDAFGVFGTTLPQKIGVFHSSSRKVVPTYPNASYTECRALHFRNGQGSSEHYDARGVFCNIRRAAIGFCRSSFLEIFRLSSSAPVGPCSDLLEMPLRGACSPLMPAPVAAASARHLGRCRMLCATRIAFWDKEVLSVRGFKRVGKHSEYSMRASRGRPGRSPRGSSEPPEPPFFSRLD